MRRLETEILDEAVKQKEFEVYEKDNKIKIAVPLALLLAITLSAQDTEQKPEAIESPERIPWPKRARLSLPIL